MSEDTGKPGKPKVVIATLKMPDGTVHTIPLPAKVFSSGRHGFYSQIPPILCDDEVYGGQIQVWKKSNES